VFQLLLRYYDPSTGADPHRWHGLFRPWRWRICASASRIVPQDAVIFSASGAGEHPLWSA
jgi:hypothetical protein